jgi:Glycosyl transferase family 2/Sulfotransferase family/Protein of unknown function (DUF3500)
MVMPTPQDDTPGPRPDSPAETAVKALYDSLTPEQKLEVCFPWDFQDPRRGLLRTFVSNHWYVTRPFIRGNFYTKKQQEIIHDIFMGIINPEWYTRFLKQMKDDCYGQDWGEEQTIAIFGSPGSGQFQFVMTGRHMTLRADGGSERHMAFGGPILYGHAAGGFYTEKPNHPGNVFWHQAEMASGVYRLLDPNQRAEAVLTRLPPETALEFRGVWRRRPGVPVASLDEGQKAELKKVLAALLDPFRPEDQARVLDCLTKQGGLDRCNLAFYQQDNLSGEGAWDNWRLEGPAFVWHFRGSPHAHVWVHVADTPKVPFNARVRFVADPNPIRLENQRPTSGAPAVNVVAISSVKNEIDIIEAFVRHTLAFVNHLVISDNGSTDGTLDILRALKNEGLPLTIVEDPSTGKYLSERMTRLMREYAVARHNADWVVPLDADEFLVLPDGARLVPPEASPGRTIAVPWRSYVPDESDDPSKFNPVLRIRHRLVEEGWKFVKVLVPGKLAAQPGAVLTQGNHELKVDGKLCASTDAEGLSLAHFPIRGPGQYLAKVAISALQYQTMGDQFASRAIHWRSPYDLLKRDLEAFNASVPEDARRFSLPPGVDFQPQTMADPIPYRGGALLHTPMVDDRARGWQAVLSYAEQLARRYAVMTRGLTPEERVALEQLITPLMAKDEEMQSRELKQLQDSRERARIGLIAELERCQRQLAEKDQAMRQTVTWRIGSLMVRPAACAVRWWNAIRVRVLGKGNTVPVPNDRAEFNGLRNLPAPILVGAVGGSGTRVVARILAHAGIHIGANRNEAEDSEPVMRFYNVWLRPYLECDGALPGDQARAAAADFRKAIIDHRQGIPHTAHPWAVKVPRNILMLPYWREVFPAARFIHVVRNGLDMAYSADNHQLQMFQDLLLPASEQGLPNPLRAMAYWRTANLRTAEIAKALFPGRYHVLRFEDLCRDPRTVIKELSAFLKAPIDLETAGREVESPASIDRWRQHSSEELLELLDVGRSALAHFGYQDSRWPVAEEAVTARSAE